MTAVALVTGGTGGIGRAICRRLAGLRRQVVAGDVGVTVEPGPDGVAGRSIVDFPLDVTDEDSVGRCVAAAAAPRAADRPGELRRAWCARPGVDEMPEAEAAAMWEINVMGSGRVTRAVLPHMPEGAAIVHIGSIAGAVGRFAGHGHVLGLQGGADRDDQGRGLRARPRAASGSTRSRPASSRCRWPRPGTACRAARRRWPRTPRSAAWAAPRRSRRWWSSCSRRGRRLSPAR